MRTYRFALVVLAALGGTGCYTYAPATLETVAVGSKVRALLSTEAQVDLHRRVGIDARQLEGELVELDESELLLSVRVPPPPTGFVSGPLHQRIDIARPDVLRVDVRRLDGVRTGVLIGGIVAAATAAVVVAAEGGNPGSPGNGGGPGPEESRRRLGISVPVFRF